MPAKLKNQIIPCEFFVWKVFRRNGVYQADGRSNQYDLGRHSLGTKNWEEAKRELLLLDREMAVQNGKAERFRWADSDSPELSLDQAFGQIQGTGRRGCEALLH